MSSPTDLELEALQALAGLNQPRVFPSQERDHIADRDEASGNYPETRITSKEEKPENLIFNFTVSHVVFMDL